MVNQTNQTRLTSESVAKILGTMDQMIGNAPLGQGHILNCVEVKHLLHPTPDTQRIQERQAWPHVDDPDKRVVEILDRLIREAPIDQEQLRGCEEAKALIAAHGPLDLPKPRKNANRPG